MDQFVYIKIHEEVMLPYAEEESTPVSEQQVVPHQQN